MIDEKKLIESFRASLNTGRETFPIDLIIERIEDQPKVGEWIPCSERLPNVEDFIKAYRRKKYSAEFIVMIDGATRPTTLYFRKTGNRLFKMAPLHHHFELSGWRENNILEKQVNGKMNTEIHTKLLHGSRFQNRIRRESENQCMLVIAMNVYMDLSVLVEIP